MLNAEKIIRALRDKKKKYSNSCVVEKKILNSTLRKYLSALNNDPLTTGYH
jgi:hypothetical protein